MKRLLRAAADSVMALCYPPLCLHCRDPLRRGSDLFCSSCQEQLEFIDNTKHCPCCFSTDWSGQLRLCRFCQKAPSPFNGVGAALEYFGPAASLVKRMKYSGEPYLAMGASAFLVAQWGQLGWPMPDYIVPAPITLLHRLVRGYNQSALLAQGVGRLLNRPVADVLKREHGGWRQAGLSKLQRRQLSSAAFSLRTTPQLLQDKTVLLIDDVLTTGATLRCCATALASSYPASIYGLCLCSATL